MPTTQQASPTSTKPLLNIGKGTFKWLVVTILVLAVVNRFFWEIPVSLFYFGILMVTSLSSIHRIPTVHYGLQTILETRRTLFSPKKKRAAKEGWRSTLPLGIGRFELFRIEIETTKIKPFTSTSFDSLDMKIEASVQWWADRTNLGRFIEVDEATIREGLVDAVESRLGEVAGRTCGDDFYKNRAALVFYINCLLMLAPENQPDLDKHKKPVVREEGEPSELVYDLEAFMKDSDNQALRRTMLKEEFGEDQRSGIERLYGIQIKAFFLDDVNFTPETRKALEARRQREYQMQGASEVLDWKLQTANKIQDKFGVGGKDALDTADLTVEQVILEKGQEPRVKKQVISVGDVDKAVQALDVLRRAKILTGGGKEEPDA
jgi:hypothetical protein